MYFKKKNCVTSIVYVCVFDLRTTNYQTKKEIFGTILTERNTTAMKKQQQPSTKDFKITQKEHLI